MQPEAIQKLIEDGIKDVQAIVTGDGSHFQAIVIGNCFEGKSMVQQQKLVYAVVNEHIASGEIHALSIKTYTPEQWKTAQNLQVGGV